MLKMYCDDLNLQVGAILGFRLLLECAYNNKYVIVIDTDSRN